MNQRDFKIEYKAKGDTGKFEGYASIFGNVDDGYDVIEAGAFKEFALTGDNKTLVLWHHKMTEPIGKASVWQDNTGLGFEGELIMADPLAQRAHIHMKAGTIDGMSVGFDVLPGGAEYANTGVRVIKAAKLWEISVVTFGMNPLARIESVKAAQQITTIREFEDFLRDAGGFSKAQAKQLASGGFKSLQGLRDAGDADGLTQLLATVDSPNFLKINLT